MLFSPAAMAFCAEPADTAAVRSLEGVSVVAKGPRRVVDAAEATVSLSSSVLDEMPKTLGHADPMRALQMLPQVATGGDLSVGIYVEGCDQSQNRVSIDGAHVVNPAHMLGIFPVFNASHFEGFTMRHNAHKATEQNFIGASIDASTPSRLDDRLSGTATIGLIDASATVKTPLAKGKDQLALSGRVSYLDKVYPRAISIDDASIKYGFEDFNATYTRSLGQGVLKANVLWTADRMRLTQDGFNAGGRFGWHNAVGAVDYSDSVRTHQIAFSSYSNRFTLMQNGMSLRLPSAVAELSYRSTRALGEFLIEADASGRWIEPQHAEREFSDGAKGREFSLEASVGANWSHAFSERVRADLGLRMALYHAGGYTRVYPMPRVGVRVGLPASLTLSAYYGHLAQFTHLVQESGMGLPSDYFIGASRRFRPETAHSASLTLSGPLPGHIATFAIGGYYRRLYNLTEFDGSILNMINGTYDPLDDLLSGDGHAYGLSVTLTRNFGPVRAWVGYNLGHSVARFERLGHRWFPSDHDRRHDLTATATWDVSDRVGLSASFVYATGTPYTEAAYGYILGENFICEYFSHNSSRMPAYKRLDLSADWTVHKSGRASHKLNVSIYNALMAHNVLFMYTSYNPKTGAKTKKSVMKAMIPSISYTIEF